MDDYVSNGKVYLIHRDFPLPMHAHSRVAARYARAAALLGKGEAVEQTLFQNQEKWEQNGDVDGTVAAVLSAAEMTKVRALVKGGNPRRGHRQRLRAWPDLPGQPNPYYDFPLQRSDVSLLRCHDLRHSQAVSRSAALTEMNELF